MIVLDGERFIEEAIRSILDQTYPALELVVVDDGSTDSSAAIVDRLATEATVDVRLVRHPGGARRGMSASRNLGVEESRGELIAFLDADDVWLPAKTAEQVAVMSDRPEAAMVYGRTQIWHSWHEAGGRPDYFYDLGVEPDRLYPPGELLAPLLRNRNQSPTTCNFLVRRDAFDRVGGFEESFRGPLYDDHVFFSKLYLQHATWVAGACWARYRQHPRSASAAAARVRFPTVDYYRRRRPFMEWFSRHAVDVAPDVASVAARELARARHPYLAALELRVLARRS
jgi:glycosyltransferase involved in cell wall biosynthesis